MGLFKLNSKEISFCSLKIRSIAIPINFGAKSTAIRASTKLQKPPKKIFGYFVTCLQFYK